METNLNPICTAISLTMADWPSLYQKPSDVLHHWLFVNGNGIEFDEDSSSLVINCTSGTHLLHEFPDTFLDGAMRKKSIRKWRRHGEQMWRMRSGWGREVTEEEKKQDMKKHKFVHFTAEDLTEEALFSQIEDSRSCPRRQRIAELTDSDEYKYVRPYPLCQYARINYLTENSPLSVLTVALNFANAWAAYLDRDLELGNYVEGQSYSNKEWTERHLTIIREHTSRLETYVNRQLIEVV